MHLEDLKQKTPVQLIAMAEEMEIENVASMRKQELMFAILKAVAENDESIFGGGVIEVLQDGFGFLRSADASYLAGPDDIYVSPSQIRRFSLRTGDSIDGKIRLRVALELPQGHKLNAQAPLRSISPMLPPDALMDSGSLG